MLISIFVIASLEKFVLQYIFFIKYFIWFEKNKEVQTLQKSESEINETTFVYIAKLCFIIQKIDIAL